VKKPRPYSRFGYDDNENVYDNYEEPRRLPRRPKQVDEGDEEDDDDFMDDEADDAGDEEDDDDDDDDNDREDSEEEAEDEETEEQEESEEKRPPRRQIRRHVDDDDDDNDLVIKKAGYKYMQGSTGPPQLVPVSASHPKQAPQQKAATKKPAPKRDDGDVSLDAFINDDDEEDD